MSQMCPVWVGYLLASPVRKLFQNPEKILAPFTREGMTVLDVGCAMGFFSLPAARLVGEGGKVVCIDCQEKMLKNLRRRAQKAGVEQRIETRMCTSDDLMTADLKDGVDMALAVAMVHEVNDPHRLLRQISGTVKPDGIFYVAEPLGHVSVEEVEKTREIIQQEGFRLLESHRSRRLYGMYFKKVA